jgi:8-oxo-dGTP diphosphatase
VPTTFTDEATWYASLATMYGTAAALITSPAGDVLLVKPNYRDLWSLPGGILEDGEPPHAGCAREVEEELGLSVPVGPLLAVDWVAADESRPRPIVAFLFDGGVLADPSVIVLQESELDEFRFVPPSAVAAYLPEHMTLRVTAGLRALGSGTGPGRAVYVPVLAGGELMGRGGPATGADQ